jgi:hypothetical protein
MKRPILYLLLLLISALFISGCEFFYPRQSETIELTYDGSYRINPVFWEYYHLLGGEKLFGPAITNIFTLEGKKMQYLENGLLVYDPQDKNDAYGFSNLGEQLNIYEPPDTTGGIQDFLMINGYRIHPAFVEIYRQLGSRAVGAPLTNPQENYAQNRIEQHFQNLGFYVKLDDPNAEVHLLAYGRAVCGPLCLFEGGIENAVITTSSLKEPFAEVINRLGVSTTGALVGGPFIAPDGFEEVIFEHLALYNYHGYITARPVVLLLGYDPQLLVEPLDLPAVVFIVVDGNLGHNVLIQFDDFINQIGGYEVSGMPVSEVFEFDHEHGVIRQCFTNMCLDYYIQEQEAQVRPASLGTEYKNALYPNLNISSEDSATPTEAPSFTPRNSAQNIFQINAWESSPLVSSHEPQTLYASVFFDGTPQVDQQLTLTIFIPDAPPQTVFMPVTGSDGKTAIALAPVATSNGSLIIYEICLPLSAGVSECARESYMIWGN